MRNTLKLLMLAFAAMSVAVQPSCNDNYDPIGNNKPSPTLKITPQQMTFNGAGGDFTSTVTTNVEAVEIGTSPEWIESATLSADYKTITVKAKANADATNCRTGTLAVKTKSGLENDAVQYLRFVQGAQDGVLTYESFAGKTLPENWKITGNTAGVKVDGSAMSVVANTSVVCRIPTAEVMQKENRVIATVDMKGGQGGLITYVNDDKNDAFLFAFSVNDSKTQGFFFAAKKGGTEPMAMDNFPQEGLDPISPACEDWFRIEFTSATKWPNWWQAQVTVYSLENKNGELKILGKHYTRQFEIDGPKPKPGYFGVICREGTSNFKDFTLSAQHNNK